VEELWRKNRIEKKKKKKEERKGKEKGKKKDPYVSRRGFVAGGRSRPPSYAEIEPPACG